MKRALPMLLILAACASEKPLQQLQARPIEASSFTQSLASEYRDFSVNLAELDLKRASEKMARKGLVALDGIAPAPEPASDDTMQSYRTLQQHLSDNSVQVLAQTVARAQVLLDCQAFTDLPDDVLASCREEFDAAVKQLNEAQEEMTPSYLQTLYFKPGSSKLTKDGKAQINALSSRLLSLGNYYITITGHTAASGDSKADDALAQKRAERVTDALEAYGVPARRLQTVSLGSILPVPNITDATRQDRVVLRLHVD